MAKEKKIRRSYTLSPSTVKQLQKLAKDQDRKMSTILERLIKSASNSQTAV